MIKEDLMMFKGVVGVGSGNKYIKGRDTGRQAIIVFVRKKLPLQCIAGEDVIPHSLNGTITDVVEIGDVMAQQLRTDKWRPAPGGVSIGHYNITAGTLGCLVKENNTGNVMILSNNHVLADSNNADIGDDIYQPGPYDGGGLSDTIATLRDFVPIQFVAVPSDCTTAILVKTVLNFIARMTGSKTRLEAIRLSALTNVIDAATAYPLNEDSVIAEILEVGIPKGPAASPKVNMQVVKSGRTTGVMSDKIISVGTTINVGYGAGKTAIFTDQVVAGPMSAGGDSGSLVMEQMTNRVVGLLFAGSDQATIFSPWKYVESELGVTLYEG